MNMCENNVLRLTNTSTKNSPSSYAKANRPYSELVTNSGKPQQSYSRPSTYIKDPLNHERKKSPKYDHSRDDRNKKKRVHGVFCFLFQLFALLLFCY